MFQCDTGWKNKGTNVPTDQDAAHCPSGSIRTSACYTRNLRNSPAAKEGAAVRPAGSGADPVCEIHV